MKILYDYQAFTMQKYGGVSKCFCELISHLPSDVSWNIGIKESNNAHLHSFNIIPNLSYSTINRESFIMKRHFLGKGYLYSLTNRLFPCYSSMDNVNKHYSIKLLKEKNYDIFHPTFFDDYFLPYLNGKPFVLTIHDMIPELFPQYFKKNDPQIVKKRKLASLASAIVAVSEKTKQDIIDILHVPKEKIHVIYHGTPKKQTDIIPPVVDKPYFLYMGTRGQYKNFQQTAIDFADFTSRHKDVVLVCTGDDFNKQERMKLKSLHLEDRIIHIQASEQIVVSLYTHAIAFVYPSLYEGFGMPILEAYAARCPVLLNNKSCFPEIAGDAAVFFCSDEASSNLSYKMEQVWNWSQAQREEFIMKGYNRMNLFSWQESAKKLYDLYASIYKSSPPTASPEEIRVK